MVEDLRYLDPAVLMAFLRARGDFADREPDHYTVQLGYVCTFLYLLIFIAFRFSKSPQF